MQQYLTDKTARWALLGLGLLCLGAILAPALGLHDPNAIDLSRRLLPPGAGAWLGTDDLGRDIAARMIYGARVSLGVGSVAALLTALIGVLMGSLAAYFRGWVDMAIMRSIDILLCLPTIYLVLALIAMLGPGIFNVMLVIVVTGWTDTARLIRAEILSLRDREYVLSARAAGAGPWRLMLKHLIPNAMTPIYVTATFGVAGAIQLESVLSFLGLGVKDPMSSWGSILDGGRQYIGTAWWLTVFPGLAILVTVLLVNALGESLQRYFDPRNGEARHA